jgi:cob(I)alamin adenosyltransferase
MGLSMAGKRSITTRRGDDGKTDLVGGTRVPKSCLRIQAMGDLDELNSHLGLAQAFLPADAMTRLLLSVQSDLFVLGSMLAQPATPGDSNPAPTEKVIRLEKEIRTLEESLPPMRTFLLPGGTPAAALLHVARSICRRAERSVVALTTEEVQTPHEIQRYLNRLSDLLFVLAREANRAQGRPEVEYTGSASSGSD